MGIDPIAGLFAEGWRRLCVAGLTWALREIHPLHDDVPYIVHRLHYLTRRTK